MYGIMCPVARPLGSSGKRKGTTMNNDEQNWEQTINWERFDPPAGGREFFDYMKTSLPMLDEAIRLLRADYERETARLASQSEVARLAERLQREFDAIAGSEMFQRILEAMDKQVKVLFPCGELPTIGEWLRWGGHITRALRNGSLLPDGWQKDKAKAARELATAENLRKFVSLYVSVTEDDYRIRFAPIRLKTKLFREISKRVTQLVVTGEALEREQKNEGFVTKFWNKAREILDMARKTQKACRQMRKTIDRIGERYWREASEIEIFAKTA